MFKALSQHHLNNLMIFPGNGNVNRVCLLWHWSKLLKASSGRSSPSLIAAFLLKSLVQIHLFRFGMNSGMNEEGMLGEKARCKQLRDKSSLWVHVWQMIKYFNTYRTLLIHAKQASFLMPFLIRRWGERKWSRPTSPLHWMVRIWPIM